MADVIAETRQPKKSGMFAASLQNGPVESRKGRKQRRKKMAGTTGRTREKRKSA
jgi:hypothetical protein